SSQTRAPAGAAGEDAVISPACHRCWLESRSPQSRKARELRKVRFALFQERVFALFRLLGEVIEERRVAGELLHSRKALGRRVESRFDKPNSRGRFLENLPRPLNRGVLELIEWYHGIDEAHFERLLGRILATQ